MAGSAMAVPVELMPRQACSDLQLVFLPGTTESGPGIVGGPLEEDFTSTIPGTTAHVIDYDTRPEYAATVAEGARKTEQYITDQAARCPNQRFILSGYSKGAMVIHRTNPNAALKTKIFTIAVFGDPNRKSGSPLSWPINSPSVNKSPRDGSTPAQNIVSFCNSGDEFCDHMGSALQPHLQYGKDGSTAITAKFVKKKL
ncbi:hypothetical protein FRC12_012314 [Ceratobasidium sp. 428]|nr:hypothetical protein FRC12_012314 [Ceratobasidium sp. 428]